MSIITETAARIVAAYVSNNDVPVDRLALLGADVYRALDVRPKQVSVVDPSPERPVPAVAIKKSVTPDFIVCLEDGKNSNR